MERSNIFDSGEDGVSHSNPTRSLLQRVDGLLGVALHRGVDEDWKREARSTINEIRRLL